MLHAGLYLASQDLGHSEDIAERHMLELDTRGIGESERGYVGEAAKS
jgi:hypothetical protein